MKNLSLQISRRRALQNIAWTAAAASVAPMTRMWAQSVVGGGPPTAGPFTVPPLPYAFDALEPHIDAQTMQIHHDKHHAAYVTNLNKALADAPELGRKPIEELLSNLNAAPEKVRVAVRNQGGGHYNHTLFWQMMKKGGGGEPRGELAQAIDKAFGSFSGFKDKFTEAATKQFGSGWAWLVAGAGKALTVESMPNQDTPLSAAGKTPILGIDVWEHAYYLKYQNRRPEYIKAFQSVINWDFVSDRYSKAAKA